MTTNKYTATKIWALVKENETLRKRVDELNKALGDVIDGNHQFDLADMTGESPERCQEILDLWER